MIQLSTTTSASNRPNLKKKPKVMRSKDQWRTLLTEFKASGLTQAVFCKKHRIAASSLYKWRKHFNQPPSSPEFIELSEPLSSGSPAQTHLPPQPSCQTAESHDWQVELELGSGMILRLRGAL